MSGFTEWQRGLSLDFQPLQAPRGNSGCIWVIWVTATNQQRGSLTHSCHFSSSSTLCGYHHTFSLNIYVLKRFLYGSMVKKTPALPEVPGFIPAPTWQLATICDYSSRKSRGFFWPLWAWEEWLSCLFNILKWMLTTRFSQHLSVSICYTASLAGRTPSPTLNFSNKTISAINFLLTIPRHSHVFFPFYFFFPFSTQTYIQAKHAYT